MISSRIGRLWAPVIALAIAFLAGCSTANAPVTTANGPVRGIVTDEGIRVFEGIPFAAPPVGPLRWKAPQPAADWQDVREAAEFGPRCMQRPIYSDMVFRSDTVSEDCLYLNVWTPATSSDEKLPVLVYFYGGGFRAGDASELRYDGASMAKRGIVAVTANYRLGVFGFLAHPELTAESPEHASGNYGFLDQVAALRWVHDNIAAFGGDPSRVTIAGESAGSMSVSALMASPLSKDLIAGAIGESGAEMYPTARLVPLASAEESGVHFAETLGAGSLAELRAVPAERVLTAAAQPGAGRFSADLDGDFLSRPLEAIYAAGDQAHVPLLVGWNSRESGPGSILQGEQPSPDEFAAALREIYGDDADAALAAFPASTPEEVLAAATRLASARFIAFSTWKWADLHGKTGDSPVYRYYYSRPRPATNPTPEDSTVHPPADGAVHSAEIEYAMGNLATNRVYAWTPDDYAVSAAMQSYFANFIKTGDPNGADLPEWPAANTGDAVQVMNLDVDPHAAPAQHEAGFHFLDEFYAAERAAE